MLAEDYKNYSGSDSSWAVAIKGLDQVKERFGAVAQEHPTWRISIDDIFGEGDKVGLRMTFLEEGKPVANSIAIYRFSGGKIVDDWYCSRRLES